MNILISGGTGMIGEKLTQLLTEQKHQVYILTRHPQQTESTYIHFITWQPPSYQKVLQQLQENNIVIDVIYNLSGAPIGPRRWTSAVKKEIRNSRIDSTKALVELVHHLEHKPSVWVNASAIGGYEPSSTVYDDTKDYPYAKDFLGSVVKDWEQATAPLSQYDIRVIYSRFGLILDSDKGAFPPLLKSSKLGAGGKIADGNQWYSWIHIDDCIKALAFVVTVEAFAGVVNFTSIDAVRQHEFAKELGDILHRPTFIPVPRFAINTVFGESAMLVTKGQHAVPTKLTQNGFIFKYPTLRQALIDLTNK